MFIPVIGVVVQNVNRLNLFNHTPLHAPKPAISRSVSTESISDLVFVSDAAKHSSPMGEHAPASRKSSSATIRFDILDMPEIRNLLLSFLQVVKYSGCQVLTKWWDFSSSEDQSGFLAALKICLDCFQYDPVK